MKESLQALPFFAQCPEASVQSGGDGMAADLQQLGQFRRIPAEDPAEIYGLPLLRGQLLQQIRKLLHRFPLQHALLGAPRGRKQLFRRKRFERMPAEVVRQIFGNGKQPALCIPGIAQLFKLLPGLAERRVRRFGCLERVPRQFRAEAEQFGAGRIDVLQIERLSFLEGKKNGLFTVSSNETANARDNDNVSELT